VINIIEFESYEGTMGEQTELDKELKIKVQLLFFSSIRSATNKDQDEVYIHSESTVYELLQFLSSIYGDKFKGEIFQPSTDDLRDDLTVSVNGIIAEHSKINTMKVTDGAIIALLPTFPGGG